MWRLSSSVFWSRIGLSKPQRPILLIDRKSFVCERKYRCTNEILRYKLLCTIMDRASSYESESRVVKYVIAVFMQYQFSILGYAVADWKMKCSKAKLINRVMEVWGFIFDVHLLRW